MSATLPSCSGVFFRLHCRHQHVFEKEYKRSNRNRGTKILRCFPHCCPSHVERSYCGSSLELAVELHQPLPVDAHSLYVFARFETVDLETTLSVGEVCSLRTLQNMSQSESNPEATWIQGTLQTRAATATTRVFLLNGQTSSKWYYHWESGANKARRLTKHLLKAYILYRRPTSSTSDRVQVIGIVSSPPFTLVSYRRAAWEGLEGGEGEGAYAADGDGNGEYDLHQVVQDQISQAFHDFQKQSDPRGHSHQQNQPTTSRDPPRFRVGAYMDHQNRPRDSLYPIDDEEEEEFRGCDNCGHYRRARPPPASSVVRDQWLWERQHTAMTLHMKDLAIVYYFVSKAPMALAMQSFRVREHVYAALQQHWTSATEEPHGGSTASSLHQPAVFLSLLFPSHDSPPSRSSGASADVVSPPLENLLLIVAKLAIWLLAPENVALFREFFAVHGSVLLHKRSLRDAFLHFAGLLCKRIHMFWSREVKPATADGAAPRDSAFKALRTMSESIISIAHSHIRFQHMWPDIREILEAPGTIMWESFIAQLRETYSRQTGGMMRQRRRARLLPAPRSLQALSGSWVIDASTATMERVASSSSRSPDVPSISETLLVMAQCQHVHIRVADVHTILVRSDSSLLSDENPWMQLVCDSSARTSGAFPFGLSSLVGAQLLGGDYVATLDAARSRLQVDLFWWPLQTAKASAYAVRMTLVLQLDAEACNVHANLELQHGALDRRSASRERLGRIDLWTAKERAALCSTWTTVSRAYVCLARTD